MYNYCYELPCNDKVSSNSLETSENTRAGMFCKNLRTSGWIIETANFLQPVLMFKKIYGYRMLQIALNAVKQNYKLLLQGQGDD